MSSTATSQVKTRPGRGSGSRGAGQRGGRGGARGKSGSGPKRPPTEKAEETTQATVTPTAKEAIETPEVDDNIAICWICAEPVKYYSVSQCNHRTCHVCSLRLRALYKKMDCTFCKVRVEFRRRSYHDTQISIGTTTDCDIHYVRGRPILVLHIGIYAQQGHKARHLFRDSRYDGRNSSPTPLQLPRLRVRLHW